MLWVTVALLTDLERLVAALVLDTEESRVVSEMKYAAARVIRGIFS